MIISRKYRYLFIELPLTASTAIAKELIDQYAGESVLYKHANYRTFLKSAKGDESQFFKFIGVRNPLDQAVSHYYKYLNDHKGKYSKPQSRQNGRIKYWLNERGHQKKFRFIQDKQATFEEYFLKFYTKPYLDWSLLDAEKMDAVIRFEHIQADFASALTAIGVEQVRNLPQVNATSAKKKVFWEHYDNQSLRERAAEVFGPYMKIWNYEFPADWNVERHSQNLQTQFEKNLKWKKIYWSILS